MIGFDIWFEHICLSSMAAIDRIFSGYPFSYEPYKYSRDFLFAEAAAMEGKEMNIKDSKAETIVEGFSGQAKSPPSSKTNVVCLCSPTTHAGSFRCRIHRSASTDKPKSFDPSNLLDSASSEPDSSATDK